MRHKIGWTSEKIAQRIHLITPLVYRYRQPLPPFRFLELDEPTHKLALQSDLDSLEWTVVPPNTHWAKPDQNFILWTQFHIPQTWTTNAPIALSLPLGEAGDFSHPEALVYINETPLAACDRHHQEIILPTYLSDEQEHRLTLHGWTGGTQVLRFDGRSHQSTSPSPSLSLLMGDCAIVQIDPPTRDFIALARVALGVADVLHEDDPTRAHLFNTLDDAFKLLDTREPFGERFYASVPKADACLRAGVERAGRPLDVNVTAVGHAHIDVAWLWTLAQTRQKVGRTFHTVIHLMAQFPDFRFLQSQPQLYDYVRQDYPELFQAIQERVHAGQWETIGGMWVEADCNLAGGESLARQFVLGREFFRKYFGDAAESPVLWLPDVFGYAWNLPQLIKEAGLEYFFTIKLGWNQYNRLPYDSFWWQGLDGTRVLTHFSPTKQSGSAFASTYNAAATPQEVISTWTNFQQKDGGKTGITPPLLMAYGYGDGGGGPTREMLENIREMEAFAAVPQTHFGTATDFFRKLEADVGDQLPIWNGELYLEYHRGTYTTQARNKRANRQSEFLLHDAEFLAAYASVINLQLPIANYEYPHQALRRGWELVCLNQFHDIIPGTSIGAVYEDSLRQYAEVRELGERVKQQALQQIAAAVGGDLLIINPTSFWQSSPVFWETQLSQGVLGQRIDGGFLLDVGEIAPYTALPYYQNEHLFDDEQDNSLTVTQHSLENRFLRVQFNEAGDIVRIYDKENGRDVLPPNTIANQFQLFEDRPKTPDAWEIDISYDDRMWLAETAVSIQPSENGPLRATLTIKCRIGSSEIEQHISLTHNSRCLDFKTVVQWHERHMMLKVAFPVDVLSPVATYEIQWGNVQRPTHRNSSWDWARFETCAQKWVDLSESGYGVSLLNDCKYGHDIHENVIRLTLLRAPTDPDPEADQGEHRFIYTLFPHAGSWDEDTIAAAYALNDPLLVFPSPQPSPKGRGSKFPPPSGGGLGWGVMTTPASLLSVDQPNIIIETIKQAEDGRGLIVRLYESQRRRGAFTLNANFPIAQAWRANLLEENQESVTVSGHQVQLFIKPYQIMTLRILPGRREITA